MGNIGKIKQIRAYVNEEEYNLFLKKCEKEDRSMSYVLKRFIKGYGKKK